jgi:replication factor A1
MADYVGPPLHRGTVRQVLQQNATGLRPVLQIIDVKQIGTNGQQPQQPQAGGATTERFRLIVSDGEHYQQAMLATQLNGLVTSGVVRKFSVVQVDECVAHSRWSAAPGRRGE